MWWMDGQYCFLLYSVNKSSYIIYITLSCYLIITPTMFRFLPLCIENKRKQMCSFLSYNLPQNSAEPQTFKNVYCLMYINSVPTL